MKEKRIPTTRLSRAEAISLFIAIILSCLASFGIALDNPYSVIGRFHDLTWDGAQKKLFFTKPQYGVFGLGLDGHITCEQEAGTKGVVQSPTRIEGERGVATWIYEDGTKVEVVYEPLQLFLAGRMENFRLILSREGDDSFKIDVDRFALYEAQMRCNGGQGWLIAWSLGLLVGVINVRKLIFRLTNARYRLLAAYVILVLFWFFMGYCGNLLRGTLNERLI